MTKNHLYKWATIAKHSEREHSTKLF